MCPPRKAALEEPSLAALCQCRRAGWYEGLFQKLSLAGPYLATLGILKLAVEDHQRWGVLVRQHAEAWVARAGDHLDVLHMSESWRKSIYHGYDSSDSHAAP
jgi:hypothetical protein